MNSKVYFGLGSNVGESKNTIAKAIIELNNKGFKLKAKSSFYETKAYGNVNQNNFINSVILCETELDFEQTFVLIKGIEKKLGRLERERWGPREIDIDILLFNNLVFSNTLLTIPHPEIIKRDFVIKPLLEINSEIIIPGINVKIKEIDFSKIESNIICKFD